MMISETMNKHLNDQIALEFQAAHNYLAMACAFDQMGLPFLAKKFVGQSDEERSHGMKILGYIQEVGGLPVLTDISTPKADFKSIEEIVKAALASEMNVTKKVNDLVDAAQEEKDHATGSFLQWFVDEQVEEVSSMTDLLTLVKLAGTHVLQVEARVRHEMATTS